MYKKIVLERIATLLELFDQNWYNPFSWLEKKLKVQVWSQTSLK